MGGGDDPPKAYWGGVVGWGEQGGPVQRHATTSPTQKTDPPFPLKPQNKEWGKYRKYCEVITNDIHTIRCKNC